DAADLRLQPLGVVIELLPRDAEDSLVAAHPEEAGAVFQNGEDAVVEETLAGGHRRPPAAFVATESAAGRSDPDGARAVLMNGEDQIAGQSVFLGEGGYGAAGDAIETSALSYHPARAVAVLVDHSDRLSGELPAVRRQRPVDHAPQCGGASDPHHAAAVFVNRQYHLAAQPIG